VRIDHLAVHVLEQARAYVVVVALGNTPRQAQVGVEDREDDHGRRDQQLD